MVMKHIKLFENNKWNDIIIKDTLDKYKNLIKLSESYFDFKGILRRGHKQNSDDITIDDMELKNDTMIIYYHHKMNYSGERDDSTYSLTKEEYEDYLIFLNNPEEYKSSIKYNL